MSSNEPFEPGAARPDARSVAKSAAVAFAAAFVATLVFVLPAEFGVDPTGIGATLGLVEPDSLVDRPESPETPAALVVGSYPGIPTRFDYFEPDVLGEPFSRAQDMPFRSDTMNVALEVGEQVEVKAVMRRGDALVYAWRVDDGVVYSDFHADPGEGAAGYPDRYFIRYRESETAESSGSLVAPFDGNHGWYWLNIEEHPVTVMLDVRGYYREIGEIFRSYQ